MLLVYRRFELGRLIYQINLNSLPYFTHILLAPTRLMASLFPQEETSDIVLVEKYWHPGHALFIVYFGERKHEQYSETNA